MRLDEETLARIDQWRSEQADSPSRAEAMRRLVEAGLARSSGESVQFSDGEKLLLLMMRDLFSHLRPQGAESDPEFVARMIFGGHYWAGRWKMPGVFHGHADNQANVRFVVDVLDMWAFLERAHATLAPSDRTRVDQEVRHLGKQLRFPGFDGNTESELMGIARFLIDDLERFTQFGNRDLNAHVPMRGAYSRMLDVFEPLRERLVGRELTADELVEVLVARRGNDAV